MSVNLLPLWDDAELRPYLSEVKRRYGYIETIALPNLRDLPPLRIESVFIPPLLSEVQIDASTNPSLWPTGSSLLSLLEQASCLVLLGDPGSGKTTLASWLAWRLSAGLQAALPFPLSECLPIPCVLRELPTSALSSENVTDLSIWVTARLLGEHFNDTLAENIRARVRAGKYVLILDGTDEIAPEQRAIVGRWLKQANDAGAFAIATGRIVGYEDYPVDHRLSLERNNRKDESQGSFPRDSRQRGGKVPIEAWAKLRYLMPFDDSRVAAFVENWYAQRCTGTQEAHQKAKDLLEALGKSETMQNLARIPNLLSLMAIVHRERANLPDGKALLYKEISNAYINTIDQQRKITNRDPFATYSWETREGWVAYIGFRMQIQRYSQQREISGSGILASYEDVVLWLRDAMALSYVDTPEERAKEFLDWISRRSGLLIPRSDDLFSFAHLSFQEYFCARYLATQVMSRQFIRTSSGVEGYVTKDKIGDWAKKPVWREVLVFFLEIISAEQEKGWVEEFLEMLFPRLGVQDQFGNNESKLAARIISDQHIHFNPEIRRVLAQRSSREAFDEWRYYASRTDRGILKYLIDSEYAIAFFDADSQIKQVAGIAPSKLPISPKASSLASILILRNRDQFIFDELPPLDELRFASITYSNIADVTALTRSRNLQVLEITGTPIKDISPLAKCASIEELNLSGTKVEDISLIKNFKSLRALDLNDNNISDLTALQKLKIEYLSLANTGISSLKDIIPIKSLLYVNLDETAVDDLSEIPKLRSLHGVGISSAPIEDLNPLLQLKNLVRLDIDVCESNNPAVIGEMKSLEVLHFGLKRPGDISFIRNLKNLETLALYGEYINDISWLAELPNLRELHLKSTNIDPATVRNIRSNLREFSINGLPA